MNRTSETQHGPRVARGVPKLCLHRPSGRAYVRLGGKMIYLGHHGTSKAAIAYEKLVAGWIESGCSEPPRELVTRATTVADLILGYLEHVDARLRSPDGTLKRQADNVRAALRPLNEAFGRKPARLFGPEDLFTLQRKLAASGRARRLVNYRVNVCKRMFRWAVAHDLVPADLRHRLDAVENVKCGEFGIREGRKVGPVAWEHVETVLAHVSRQVRALILLQWWCGARSGELLTLRPAEIDRSGPTWQYRPAHHKSAHHGRDRVIDFGPHAQEVLRPFLDARVPPPDPSKPLLRPDEAEAERRVEQRRRRRTGVQPSQSRRCRKPTPVRKPAEAYTVHSYRRAIERGTAAANAEAQREAALAAVLPLVPEVARPIVSDVLAHLVGPVSEQRLGVALSRAARLVEARKRLGARIDSSALLAPAVEAAHRAVRIPPWHPHQLRHSCATRLRREAGLEAARVVLGHASSVVTELYAEIDHARAREIAAKLG